jgi:hypothetical protein
MQGTSHRSAASLLTLASSKCLGLGVKSVRVHACFVGVGRDKCWM